MKILIIHCPSNSFFMGICKLYTLNYRGIGINKSYSYMSLSSLLDDVESGVCEC